MIQRVILFLATLAFVAGAIGCPPTIAAEGERVPSSISFDSHYDGYNDQSTDDDGDNDPSSHAPGSEAAHHHAPCSGHSGDVTRGDAMVPRLADARLFPELGSNGGRPRGHGFESLRPPIA